MRTKTIKRWVSAFALCLALAVGLFAFSSCGSVKYTLFFDDADVYAETVMPVHSVGGGTVSAYAWNMMQITSMTVEVGFEGSEYTYFIEEYGNKDTSAPLYWHRTFEFKGEFTKEGEVYTMSAPTKCTNTVDYGPRFADYEVQWGKEGTFTEADKPKLLKMFTPCTATVNGDAITFALTE